MTDTDEEVEIERDEPYGLTVRGLIHELVTHSPSLDAAVSCSVKSGNNVIVFMAIDVNNITADDSEGEDGAVDIGIAFPAAWDHETLEDLPAGILTLEDERW